MSVLGIAEARKPDGGRWACSANDAGRKRCRALKLAVLRPPDIRLIPSALTVNKVTGYILIKMRVKIFFQGVHERPLIEQ